MQVLIIADDHRQAEFIQKGLKYENLPTDIYVTNGDINKVMEMIPFYDGVILVSESIALSRFCIDEIEKNKPKIPIIVLSHEFNAFYKKLYESKKICAHFTRPFPIRNISSEIKYQIFLSKESLEVNKYILRDLELDLFSHQVTVKGKQLLLRNKEFALLHFLLSNKGRVLSRTTILENVWDMNANFMTNTVDVHISQLRKKLRNNGDDEFIHTIPCSGYIIE